MNQITLRFRSQLLEKEYLNQSLEILVKKHQQISYLIIFILAMLIIVLSILKNFIAAGIIFFANALMVLQLLYYTKNKSLNCSIIIAIINILATAERWNFAVNPELYPNTDFNGHFIMGLSFMAIHQNLLFDPRFFVNSIVYTIITISYTLADYFSRNEFNYGVMPFICCLGFQLYGNYIQQRIRREQFLYKRRNQRQENIGFKIIKEPCALFYYDHEKFSFILKDSNQGFKDLFQDELEKKSLNKLLSEIEIDSQNKNVQSYCYSQIISDLKKETQGKFNCWFQGNQKWKCEICFDTVDQPTFMILFDQSKKLSEIIKLQKVAIQSLKVICRFIFIQNLNEQKYVNQTLRKANRPNVYQIKKQQILQQLQNQTLIAVMCHSNTFQMFDRNHKENIKIQQFDFLTKIHMKILPMFQGKIVLIDNLNLSSLQIWSNKKIFYQFIFTFFQLVSFKITTRTFVHLEIEGNKIKFIGKFPPDFKTRFNLKWMSLKCNLKILGTTDKITLDRNNKYDISIYKDLREVYQ